MIALVYSRANDPASLIGVVPVLDDTAESSAPVFVRYAAAVEVCIVPAAAPPGTGGVWWDREKVDALICELAAVPPAKLPPAGVDQPAPLTDWQRSCDHTKVSIAGTATVWAYVDFDAHGHEPELPAGRHITEAGALLAEDPPVTALTRLVIPVDSVQLDKPADVQCADCDLSLPAGHPAARTALAFIADDETEYPDVELRS